MIAHEQIYTSAARLLEGGGNLGVVAESRGFPRQLVPSLAPFRAYTMLPQFSRANPAAYPQRLVMGPLAEGKNYGITRTVFAGADHTGRTTPLAHHLVFEIAELRQGRHGIAELVSSVWPMLAAAWPDPPKWIDPPREVVWAGEIPKAPLSAAWADLLPWVADCMMAFGQAGRAAVVVIDPNDAEDVPGHVVWALLLLPRSVQWAVGVATHVESVSDYVRDAALIFTYPQSPFLEQCRQRRDSRAPLVVAMTADDKRASADLGPWGKMIAADDSLAYQRSRERCRRFDELHLSPGDAGAFVAAAALIDDLNAAPAAATGAQWQAFGGRFAAAGSNAAIAEWLGNAAIEAIRALAADENSATRWQTLSAVAADAHWPAPARQAAVRAIVDGGNDALDAFISYAKADHDHVGLLFRQELATRPNVVLAALSEAIARPTPAALSRAAHLLPAATLSQSQAGQGVADLIKSSPPVRKALDRPLLQALEHALKKPADVIALYASQSSKPASQQQAVGRAFVLPLLRKALDRTQDTSWRELAERYRDIAIASGFREDDIEWLLRHHSRMLSWTDVQAWLSDARLSEPQRQQIRQAANRAGKTEPPIPLANSPALSAASTVEVHAPRSAIHDGAGVGPVRLGLYLATLVMIASLASAAWMYGGSRPQHVDKIAIVVALAAVASWIVIELVLRLFFQSPQRFGIVRWSRRMLVVLLLAAFVAAALPMGRSVYPALKHLFHAKKA